MSSTAPLHLQPPSGQIEVHRFVEQALLYPNDGSGAGTAAAGQRLTLDPALVRALVRSGELTETGGVVFTTAAVDRAVHAAAGASRIPVNVADVPFRFIPCMAAGLAYYIAGKIPEGAERIQMLKQQYDEAWDLAAYEDHEKAALRFVPRQQFIGNTI